MNYKAGDIKIEAAAYLRNFEILVLFSNNCMKVVDFSSAIKKYAKADYAVYSDKKHFKKFSIERGNIVWGKDWDLVFPVLDIFEARF